MDELIKIINLVDKTNINIDNYTIDDLNNLLEKSQVINKILNEFFKTNNKQSSINKINNVFIYDLINVYMDKNNVEINDEFSINVDDNPFYLELKKYKVLSKEEEKNLFIKYKNNIPEARNTIIKHNMKLVFSIAKKYTCEKYNVMDLFQEGIIGLIRAIELFDSEKNLKFSTYATWHIRQRIILYIKNNSTIINFPNYLREKIYSYKKLDEEIQRLPIKEIAHKLNISVDNAKILVDLSRSTISLNEVVNDDGDELISLTEDLKSINPEDAVINYDIYN